MLSRGNRREEIVADDKDRKRFVKTLGEADAAFENAHYVPHSVPGQQEVETD